MTKNIMWIGAVVLLYGSFYVTGALNSTLEGEAQLHGLPGDLIRPFWISFFGDS